MSSKFAPFAKGMATGVLIMLVVQFGSAMLQDIPRPAMFASLPSTTTDIPDAVDRVVKQQFPTGMSEDQIIAQLSEMGFVLTNGEHGLWARFTAGGAMCTEHFMVNWTTGPDRSVDAVVGEYHQSCL